MCKVDELNWFNKIRKRDVNTSSHQLLKIVC